MFIKDIDELKFGGAFFVGTSGELFLIRLVFTPLEDVIV
jgi:hypothetical protein